MPIVKSRPQDTFCLTPPFENFLSRLLCVCLSKLMLKDTGLVVGFVIAGFPFDCPGDLINILIC